MSRPDINALLAITTFIAARGQTTPAEIAEHLDLDVATVIDGLWSIHTAETKPGSYFLDLVLDTTEDGDDEILEPDSLVTLTGVSDEPAVYLSAGEVLVALHIVDSLMMLIEPGSDHGRSLASIRDQLAQSARIFGIHPQERTEPEASVAVLTAIDQALTESRSLTVTYHHGVGIGGSLSRYQLTPVALVSDQRTYLACLHGKKDCRWYRLDRMSQAEVGDVISADDVERTRRLLKRLSAPVPVDGDEVTFVAQRSAMWITETVPCTVEGDDPLRITVRATSTQWVRQIAILIGRDLIDIEPTSVKDEVVAQAQAILNHQVA